MLDIESILKNVPIIKLNLPKNNILYLVMHKNNLCWSIKVIPVYRILKKALEKNLLQNKEILEASSWNTWIALAFFGNLLNIKTNIVIPNKTSNYKKQVMISYWANLIEIEWNTDIAIKHRNQIFKKNPNKYRIPNQFENYNNFWSHYYITADLIIKKIPDLDFFVSWLWTSWTLLWTAKRLKEYNSKIKIIAVNPKWKIEWLRDFETSNIKIPFFEEYKYLIDHRINIDEYKKWIQELLNKNIFVWISSGAAFLWVEKYLNQNNLTDKKWVLIIPDWGENYIWKIPFENQN